MAMTGGSSIKRSRAGPCSRCDHYAKELIAKDKIIMELQQKLEMIHEMSASPNRDMLKKAKISITQVDVGIGLPSSTLSANGSPCCDVEAEPENLVHKPKLQKHGGGSGGEVNVTVQEIIDKVIECSPSRNCNRFLKIRGWRNDDVRFKALYSKFESC